VFFLGFDVALGKEKGEGAIAQPASRSRHSSVPLSVSYPFDGKKGGKESMVFLESEKGMQRGRLRADSGVRGLSHSLRCPQGGKKKDPWNDRVDGSCA